MLGRRINLALLTVFALTALLVSPHPARAGNLFDFLFGGFQQRPTPPADVNAYAAPSIDRVAPASPGGAESVRQDGGNIGRSLAFCVRACDGHQFPMERIANATPVETCRAMCPAAKTKVFFGGEISTAVAKDGQRYADSDNAFLYRKQLVANCTCNGKDAFGLAPFDMTKDSTLRPGDIVATKDGFVTYSGARGPDGQTAAFTPVETSVVAAQLNPYAPRARLTRNADAQPADDQPGIVVPSQSFR